MDNPITDNSSTMAKHLESLLEDYEQKTYDRGVCDGRYEASQKIRCATEDYKCGYDDASSSLRFEIDHLHRLLEEADQQMSNLRSRYDEMRQGAEKRLHDLSKENSVLEMEVGLERDRAYERGKRDGAKEALDSDTLEDARQEGYDKGFEAGEVFAAAQRKVVA